MNAFVAFVGRRLSLFVLVAQCRPRQNSPRVLFAGLQSSVYVASRYFEILLLPCSVWVLLSFLLLPGILGRLLAVPISGGLRRIP